ncbi:MAG: hypothetical protein V4664_00905 [Patescibacteria group bacterium]
MSTSSIPVESPKSKAWVVSVGMGYGHQRAAYNIAHLAPDGIPLNANDYENIPKHDRKIWERSRGLYEFMSNASHIPLIGGILFSLLERITKIFDFYPKRNLSESNFGLRYLESLIHKGWGNHLIEKIGQNPLPLVTTFFASAHMADYFNYKEKIFCVVTDTDIARTWVSSDPLSSHVTYFAPTIEAERRLQSYGVPLEKIILTGFPLPKSNIGTESFEIAKNDLAKRIINLDPTGIYRKQFAPLIETYLGKLPEQSGRPLTLMFSLGGAAAQRDLAINVIKSLSKKIKAGEIRLILAVGIKKEVHDVITWELKLHGLNSLIGTNVHILEAPDIWHYFDVFNQALRDSDILWTKPSELSFYAGLGIPIIIAPAIGSQEDFNREWLLRMGAGINQKNPMFADEWLNDLVQDGILADVAMHGFIEIEKKGTFNIEREICKK